MLVRTSATDTSSLVLPCCKVVVFFRGGGSGVGEVGIGKWKGGQDVVCDGGGLWVWSDF